MRVNHTSGRGGALAYLAAYDVHRARVFGRTEARTGIDPFMNLVTQVMSKEPYASAKRVFWIDLAGTRTCYPGNGEIVEGLQFGGTASRIPGISLPLAFFQE